MDVLGDLMIWMCLDDLDALGDLDELGDFEKLGDDFG